MSRHKRYEIPDIGSITFREATNRDVIDAHRAFNMFGDPSPQIRCILRTITHVNNNSVIYPWDMWVKWSEKIKTMVRVAYEDTNMPREDEL